MALSRGVLAVWLIVLLLFASECGLHLYLYPEADALVYLGCTLSFVYQLVLESLFRAKQLPATCSDYYHKQSALPMRIFLIASVMVPTASSVIQGRADNGPVGVRLGCLALCLVCALVCGWGMRIMGPAYTLTLHTIDQQQIVYEGPYAWIRHPTYSVSILAFSLAPIVARGLSIVPVCTGLALLCLGVYAYRIRIFWEELLLSHHAETEKQYRAYCKRVQYKMIPWVY